MVGPKRHIDACMVWPVPAGPVGTCPGGAMRIKQGKLRKLVLATFGRVYTRAGLQRFLLAKLEKGGSATTSLTHVLQDGI